MPISFKPMIMKAIKKPLLVLLLPVLFSAYSNPKSNFQTDDLIGVSSGFLFQTESEYDSINVEPIRSP